MSGLHLRLPATSANLGPGVRYARIGTEHLFRGEGARS